ncbi:presequence protease, mitochondrial-like isoform X1 [Ornithodoros turicata]|uniref:presequence protease, mitochondrial-like isoform X1 n=1 Tax=Ornithodoros turicata TaxID=34597 RepID=UPI003139E3FA
MLRNSLAHLKGFQASLRLKRWCHSSAVERALKFRVGEKIGEFEVRQVEEVAELHLAAVRFTHDKTGSDFLHLARDDRNNLFSVAFPTIPQDSTGVAHILEHLSLCGSDRFPCRDPFSKMLNRSLATFMNAMTGCDVTFYPFSTQNQKDYQNLLRVYLDAVFFPRLLRLDFMQEGWRFEHMDVNDKTSPITIKGVVYNEMKGVFSNSSYHFIQSVINNLYPSGVYSHCSGGHPQCIPDLTWDHLKEFHRTHYHPSNARFLTYGDFPVEHTLNLIEELALCKFSSIGKVCNVPAEPKWTQPRKANITCAVDPLAANPEKQTTVSLTYALNDTTDIHESFVLSILGYLLVNGPNSPFYKNLLESGIGADFSPFLGYDGDLKQAMFSVGLHGVKADDVEQVTDIVQKTFDEVIRDGFPEERIEAALHTIELGLKHQSTNFGMALNYALVNIWNHDGNPIEQLQVNKQIAWFKEQLKQNPQFLQQMVEKYFKGNAHVLTTVMSPDCEHENRVKGQEQENIKKRLSALSDDQVTAVYVDGLELFKRQSEKDDESCLPLLHLSDVSPQITPTTLNRFKIGNTPVQSTVQPTNGVTYFRIVLNASHLPPEMKRMLPLFCEVATKMSTLDKDYRTLSQEAELKTGGLNASVHLVDHPLTPNTFEQGVLLSSHCLESNTEAMFSLWKDIFLRLSMEDEERLSQLIQMCAAGLAQNLPDSGHRYAMTQAGNFVAPSGRIREEYFGISNIQQMKTLAEAPSRKFLLPQLKNLAQNLLCNNSMRCSVNASSSGMPLAEKHLDKFLSDLPMKSSAPCPSFIEEPDFYAKERKIHLVFPFTVNYCAKAFGSVPYTDPDYARLSVASQLLSRKFLFREVREKGGAYGAGATVTPGGTFSFYSYRDPNLEGTLDAFSNAASWLQKGEFSERDLEEAKLSCFAQVDSPVAPGNKGLRAFLAGITDEMKQQHRQRLFTATKDDVISAAMRNISEENVSSCAVIGPENEFTETGSHWMVHRDGCTNAGSADASSLFAVSKESEHTVPQKPKTTSPSRFYLKLRGLPWNATEKDIYELFRKVGIHLQNHKNGILLVKKRGRLSGEAFVEVCSKEDWQKALSHNWHDHTMGHRYIEVFATSANVIRHFLLAFFDRRQHSVTSDPRSSVVSVRGLPQSCTESDLRSFFEGSSVQDLCLNRNSGGKCLGSAFIKFASPRDAEAALSKNGTNMGTRYVEVFPSSEKKMKAIGKGELPPLSRCEAIMQSKRAPEAEKVKVRELRQVTADDARRVLESRGHRISAKGIPAAKGYREVVNFFWPAKVRNVLAVARSDGKGSGSLIIEFESHEDALGALKKNGAVTERGYIDMELYSSPEREAQTVAE